MMNKTFKCEVSIFIFCKKHDDLSNELYCIQIVL